MQGDLSIYDRMYREICREDGLGREVLSNGWVRVLTKDGQRHFVVGNKFDLNPAAAAMIVADKYATFCMLDGNSIPVVEHAILYEFSNLAEFAKGYNSLEYVVDYLHKHDNSIIIKPNRGARGRGVCKVESTDEIEGVLATVFRQDDSASMCPFYDVQYEYRTIMLDGEPRLIYAKQRGSNWHFNPGHGAKIVDVTDEKTIQNLTEIATRAMQAVGMRFASVDIIETATGELLVLEINGDVSTKEYLRQRPKKYELVKTIYRDAIRKMFSKKAH